MLHLLRRGFCVGWDARAVQTAVVETVGVVKRKRGWLCGELDGGNG